MLTQKEIEILNNANRIKKRLTNLKAETVAKKEFSIDDELLITEINLILYGCGVKDANSFSGDLELEQTKKEYLYRNIEAFKPLMLEKKELLQKETLTDKEKQALTYLNMVLDELPFNFNFDKINESQTLQEIIEILKK